MAERKRTTTARQRRTRGRRRLPALLRGWPALLAPAVLVCAIPLATAAMAPPHVEVVIDRSEIVGVSRLTIGVTHTQYSVDRWGDRRSIARAKRLLRRLGGYQNQHIYGWGTRNPQPAPGVFEWRTLDRRLRLMRRTGAVPVITLCCAPDWMTRLGTPTSEFPNLPPTPEHHEAFADLARRIALRYPQVRHFLVWNEMKGLWDPAQGNWDYRAYTDLYNAVYDALKGVDPRIQVGGPYLVLEGTGSRHLGRTGYATRDPITPRDREVLEYWLANKRGADFITVDRKTQTRHDRNTYEPGEYLGLTRWFEDVTRQLRAMTDLPIWFAEDYFRDHEDWRFQAAGLASMLAAEARGGASVSLRWKPQGVHGGDHGGNDQSLFTDTRRRGGGRPYPAYHVYAAFARRFGPGTRLVRARASSQELDVLASRRDVMLINWRDEEVHVTVEGRRLELAPYGVRTLRLR